jgi:hypothetical protein
MYGMPFGPIKRSAMRASFPLLRVGHHLIPPKYRYIAPYQEFLLRQRGVEVDSEVEKVRRSVGIRLGS